MPSTRCTCVEEGVVETLEDGSRVAVVEQVSPDCRTPIHQLEGVFQWL